MGTVHLLLLTAGLRAHAFPSLHTCSRTRAILVPHGNTVQGRAHERYWLRPFIHRAKHIVSHRHRTEYMLTHTRRTHCSSFSRIQTGAHERYMLGTRGRIRALPQHMPVFYTSSACSAHGHKHTLPHTFRGMHLTRSIDPCLYNMALPVHAQFQTGWATLSP